MDTITIDGMDEDAFRHSIEDMLRHDQIDQAVARLRGLLESCAGEGRILPARFLDVSSDDVEFAGWQKLADRLHNHDRPNHAISAIGVTLADARALGGPGPSNGRMPPFIKTFYFSDDAYPFSIATRDDLLDGYTRDGFEWEADYQATDATLSIKGIDDLYGAIVELEDRLFTSPDPGEDEIRAGTIGACYLAALIHQSLRRTIREKGLPRPMCVLTACDGVYPFFDAPVAGADESAAAALEDVMSGEAPVEAMNSDAAENDLPAEASLLGLISRKGTKKPVLVLAEADAKEATRITEMAGAEQFGASETILQSLMDAIVPDERPEEAELGEDLSWGEFEAPEHHVGPQESAPREPSPREDEGPWQPEAEVRLPPDALDEPTTEFHPPVTPITGTPDQEPDGDLPDITAAFVDAPGDDAGLDADADEAFAAPPARHSLRARTRMAEVDESRTTKERFLGAVDRLGAMVLRAVGLNRRKN